jgi:hypothetical protein
MSDNVTRTIGSWQQFFANDKRNAMLLQMVVHENKWSLDKRMTYDELMAAMTLRGSKCLHASKQ